MIRCRQLPDPTARLVTNCPFRGLLALPGPYASKLATDNALFWMKSRRGST